MRIDISEEQLEQVESGHKTALIVRSERTKREYALIPQKVYDQVRPLIQHVVMHLEARGGEGADVNGAEWTDEKNARRVALINKKHDKGLSAAEKKELRELMSEAEAYRDRVIPPGTDILKLILAGLKSQAAKSTKQ